MGKRGAEAPARAFLVVQDFAAAVDRASSGVPRGYQIASQTGPEMGAGDEVRDDVWG
jgi:hypothetical protein